MSVDINGIKERLALITEGKWFTYLDETTYIGTFDEDNHRDTPIAECFTDDDAVFIANAPEDIRSLLAEMKEIDRLRSILLGIRDYARERQICSIYLETIADKIDEVLGGQNNVHLGERIATVENQQLEDINAIKERLEKITEGEWKASHFPSGSYVDSFRTIALCKVSNRENDAEFIANAPEDIRTLLAEVEKWQQRVLDQKRKNYDMWTVLQELNRSLTAEQQSILIKAWEVSQ